MPGDDCCPPRVTDEERTVFRGIARLPKSGSTRIFYLERLERKLYKKMDKETILRTLEEMERKGWVRHGDSKKKTWSVEPSARALEHSCEKEDLAIDYPELKNIIGR